jgi:hypothetical protein
LGCWPNPSRKITTARRSSARDGSTKIEIAIKNEIDKKTNEKRRITVSKLTLKIEGDTHIVVTRHFATPPEAVYRAHTDPKLLQKWSHGPEGWTMPVCINEARPDGKFRYEWTNGKCEDFFITGEFIELNPIAGSFT